MAVCSPSLVMVVNVTNIYDVDNKKKYNFKRRNYNFKIHQNLVSKYLKNISSQLGVQNEILFTQSRRLYSFKMLKS